MNNVILQLGLAFLLFSVLNPFLAVLSLSIFPPERTLFFNPENLATPEFMLGRLFRTISPEQYIGVALIFIGGVIVVVSNIKAGKGNAALPRASRASAPQRSGNVFCRNCGSRCEQPAEYCSSCGNKL